MSSLPKDEKQAVLLHNPKCSKSRATLALLEERGLDFSVRLYLEDALDRSELDDLAGRLGKRPVEFARTGQAEFAEAGLTRDSDDGSILDAMATTPILVERPILIRGKQARIGRPPEDVLALLDT